MFHFYQPQYYTPYVCSFTYKQRTNLMGNVFSQGQSLQEPYRQGKALSKAYKSVKVRNLLTIETTQRRYLDWQNSLQNYLERVSRQALILRNQINEFFWLPISQKYRFNNNAAGQVLLQFPCGFRRLSQVICLADAQNQPFLIQSLWNLLFTLSNLVNKLGNSLHQTILCSNRIFVDKQLKKIKICTPLTDNYQLFSRQSQNHDQQNEISITGKIKGNKQMLQVSKDLLLGNLLAQCVLLESQSSQNHNILNQQRQITQKKIKRVLKVEYYPLKLRIIVAGLMQLEHRSRFTTVEVCQLLSPYQQQIKPFFVFHQRKTDFIKVFGKKLKAMQNFLPENLWKYSTLLRVDKDKLNNKNDNYQPQCINRIIPKKSITKVNRPVPLTLNNIQTHKSNRDAQMLTLEQGSPTKTLNLSISSLPRYPKKDDSSSLNYSKSDCRSPRSNFSESMVRQNSLILEEASSAEGSKYDLPLKAQQQQIVQAKNKNISNDFGFEKILMPIQQQPFQSYKVIEISQKNRKQPLGIFRIDSLETHQIYGKHYNVIQGETKNSIQEKASYFQRNEVSQRQPQGLFTEIAQKNQKQDYQKSESLYQDKISSKYSFVENGNKTQSIIDRLDDFNTTKQIHQGVDFCNPLQGSSSCQLFEFKNQSQAAKEEILLDCDSLSQGFKQAMIKKMKMIEESVARSQQQFPSNK